MVDIANTGNETENPPAVSPPQPATRTAVLLARRFTELLLDASGRRRSEGPSRPIGLLGDDFDFEMEDEPAVEESAPVATLPVDEAAAAILVASAFETDPALLRSLRREAPVVVFQIPDARLQESVKRVLQVCVLGEATNIVSTTYLDSPRQGRPAFERRSAVILDCETDRRGIPVLADRAITAMSLDVPVCAVTLDAVRAVPESVRCNADRAIVLGGWNAESLALLVEVATGQAVAVPEGSWAKSVRLDDLRMSVSMQRGASASLEKLRTNVLRRTASTSDAALLQDLSGYGDARRIGLEMIGDLTAYREGRIGWNEVGRGLVLSGPTGTGKTYFARSFSRTAGLPLVVGSLATWQASGDGHLGDCLSAMRKTFAEARASAPSVLLIDEIDSFGDRATFHNRHRDYSSQVVNALLQELDGAVDREGVVVLAATNLPHRIDPAILRPGRLDRLVEIDLPDAAELAGILRTLLGFDLPDADLFPVALAGRGGSGADAASWVRQARGAARRRREVLSTDDLLQAIRSNRGELPTHELMRVAVHEAAHACSAIVLGIGDVVDIDIHANGGTTRVSPRTRATTRDHAVATMVHLLSGRAAELLLVGTTSAGAGGSAGSDLAVATRTAVAMETSWGLGETGPFWLAENGTDLQSLPAATALLPAVLRRLRHAEAEAARFVSTCRDHILRCAEALSEARHLDGTAIAELLGDLPPFRVGYGVPEPTALEAAGPTERKPGAVPPKEAGLAGP